MVKSSKQGDAYETASNASPQKNDDEETLAETVVSIKKSTTKGKGKAIMQESEPSKKIKKKEMIQIRLDEEISKRFYKEEQAQLLIDKEYAQQVQAQWVNDEAIIAQENLAQAEQLDDVQAQIQADKDLAQRILKEQKETLSIKKSIRKFVPMKSEGQVADFKAGEGSSKDSESLKRHAEEEKEKKKNEKSSKQIEEEIAQQEDEDTKIMFEPDCDDAVWKNHHSQELIEWKLYDSCSVHSLTLGEVSIHMLVEKKYPLPHDKLTIMLQWKLHVNYNVTEMAYELLSSDEIRIAIPKCPVPGMSIVFRKKRGFFQKYIFQFIRKRFEFEICRRVDIKDHSFSLNSNIELFLFNSNYCINSVKKGSSQDEKNFAIFFHLENNEIGREDSEEFMNVFMRIDFGSTIRLVSFDESQVLTFNGNFVYGFRNSDFGTESRRDNTVGSPHGFIIHWIVISKNIKKVTELIDVENWQIDNSRVLRWIVSLIEWNSSVSPMKSSIQSTFSQMGSAVHEGICAAYLWS
nr:hypothetical protein [Tanacetum cinerariifolium]